jgi:hypothetical protein
LYPVLGAGRKSGLGRTVGKKIFHGFETAEGVIRRYAPFADRNGLNGH